MSCLTRSIQNRLTRYLQHKVMALPKHQLKPECVRARLLEQGLCSTDITADQVAVILEGLQMD